MMYYNHSGDSIRFIVDFFRHHEISMNESLKIDMFYSYLYISYEVE